jgi:hypothetical protein
VTIEMQLVKELAATVSAQAESGFPSEASFTDPDDQLV